MTASEQFKGGVHLAACVLASVMSAYNWLRFVETGSRRHLVNASIYSAAVAFEVQQTKHHWCG